MNNTNTVFIFLHLPKTGGTTFNAHLFKNLIWEEEFLHIGPWGEKYRRAHNKLPLHKRSLYERNRIKVISGHGVWYGIHELFPHKEPKYFTFIRDPAERMVSLYNHKGKDLTFDDFCKCIRKNDMVDFYFERTSQIKSRILLYTNILFKNINFQSKTIRELYNAIPSDEGFNSFKYKQTINMLDTFWKIIPTKKLDEELPSIFEDIGVPSKDWKKYRVSGDKASSVKNIHPKAVEKDYVNKKLEINDDIRKKVYDENRLDVKLYDYYVNGELAKPGK